MKGNYIFTVPAVALALLVSASCEKQDCPEINNGNIHLTAAIEQEITKTSLTSDFKVEWTAEDDLDINGAWYRATPSVLATVAELTYIGGRGEAHPPYKAIYPHELVDLYYGSYSFPSKQIYSPGKFDAPMYAESETEQLLFRNICGVICFALKGEDKIVSIDIFANEAICGEFTMTDATTVSLSGKGKILTLDCGEGVQLNPEAATNFYVYLPPAEYSAGMTFAINSSESGSFIKTTTKTVSIERSNVYTFNWTPVFVKQYPDGVLPGKFSVSNNEKVRFSQGNLFYDGNTFKFEHNPFTYPDESWSATHINSFFWSKNADIAMAEKYDDPETTINDVLFTNKTEEAPNPDFVVCGQKGKFRSLSEDNWVYLLMARKNASTLFKFGVEICGNICLVIAPDNFKGTISDSYNYSSWKAAEDSGLVCLPYSETERFWGPNGIWTSSPYKDDVKSAYSIYNNPKYMPEIYSFIVRRNNRNVIRLVTNK